MALRDPVRVARNCLLWSNGVFAAGVICFPLAVFVLPFTGFLALMVVLQGCFTPVLKHRGFIIACAVLTPVFQVIVALWAFDLSMPGQG